MGQHRSDCLEIEIPIEIGSQEILCRCAFHFDPGFAADNDDPGTPATWEVCEARILARTADGWQDVGDAPMWVFAALLKDFDAGGPTFDAAQDAYEIRNTRTRFAAQEPAQ